MEACRWNISHLRNKVSSELNVLVHQVGQVVGDEVNVSLDFVDHGIHVGHVAFVLHARAPLSADHTVNLFLGFSWRGRNQNLCEMKRLKTIFLILVTLWWEMGRREKDTWLLPPWGKKINRISVSWQIGISLEPSIYVHVKHNCTMKFIFQLWFSTLCIFVW